MADRTPVVLALLADALQARAADSPDDHDLHALADEVAARGTTRTEAR